MHGRTDGQTPTITQPPLRVEVKMQHVEVNLDQAREPRVCKLNIFKASNNVIHKEHTHVEHFEIKFLDGIILL